MTAPISPAPSTSRSDASPRHDTADFLYDAFFCAGLGGSAVALFFLVVDVVQGTPLLTPTVIGAALFQGMAPSEVQSVDLGLVASYSLVHFGVFAVLGAAISVLVHEVELHSKNPAILLFTIFAIFEVGFFGAGTVLLPGVMAWLGYVSIAAANLLAAAAIGALLVSSHRPDLWQQWKESLRLLAVGPTRNE
jgi:hypothetical protein